MNEEERHKTGERCPIAGNYRFDGYTDGTHEPAPTENESQDYIEEGHTFPPIRSAKKGCYWKLVGKE